MVKLRETRFGPPTHAEAGDRLDLREQDGRGDLQVLTEGAGASCKEHVPGTSQPGRGGGWAVSQDAFGLVRSRADRTAVQLWNTKALVNESEA